jgi:hypothetical protein
MRRVDRQHDTLQIDQSVPERGVGEFIPGPPALRHRDHQPTTPQARRMIRQRLPGHPEGLDQVGRIGRPLHQGQHYPRPGLIGQRVREPGQRIGMSDNLHRSGIQIPVYHKTMNIDGCGAVKQSTAPWS